MTFKDLYDEFRMHNDEIMKDTTKYGYDNKEKFIECFFPVKLKDFNIKFMATILNYNSNKLIEYYAKITNTLFWRV